MSTLHDGRGAACRRTILFAAAFVASLGWAQPSSGPIKLVVPFTPGTGIDLIARQIGPKLAERLGRPVIVENKAGASGNVGTDRWCVRRPMARRCS